MTDPSFRRLRVLHLAGADYHTAPNPLLLPLLTRGDRQRIESQVVHFVPGATQFAVVRQSGVPAHEVALSSQRFSPAALLELNKLIKEFKPDAIHAWGSTAQVVAAVLAGRGKRPLPIVWSVARTTPLSVKASWLDKTLFNWNKKFATKCRRIVYTSAAAAAQHRRAGLPDEHSMIIAPGVDADRYKPDPAARQRVREQLELPKDAVLIGMYAPFQPEFDHATFFKAVGELIRTNPNLYCVLAGRSVVRGNAPLMAMVGGGTLGTRTRVIGEWTDLSALFNACDVVCSTATNDSARLMLAMSMLCGVVCVATGMGAQGEVLGNFGVAVEQGSATALMRGISRVLEMPPDRLAFMQQEARKHALQNFNMARSIEKYHELYVELVTGAAPQPQVVPVDALAAALSSPTRPAIVQAANAEPVSARPIVEKPIAIAPRKVPPVAAKPVEEPPKEIEPVAAKPVEKPAAKVESVHDKPFEIDTVVVSAAMAPVFEERVMEWSAADAELIESVITEVKPVPAAADDTRPKSAQKKPAVA